MAEKNTKENEVEEVEDFEKDELDSEDNIEEESTAENSQDTDDKENEYKEKFEDLHSKFLRLQADFTNFKRRSNEERSSYVGLGVEKLAISILPILDNFNRALDMVEEKDSPVYEGMEMLQKQFVDILEKNDIKEIEAENQVFDPNFHHAVLMESVEGVEPGIVTTVLQKGYSHGDKVIRPSMVKVSE